MNERKIIIALISSSDYLHEIRPIWNPKYIESVAAKKIGTWCVEYYDEYGIAPGSHIEDIFYEKVRAKAIHDEEAEEIESDILPGLSDEYVTGEVNIPLLIKQTKQHFATSALHLHNMEVSELLEEGKTDEAEKVIQAFTSVSIDYKADLKLNDKQVLAVVKRAFTKVADPIVTYPYALGDLWNEHFVRGGFVALMAPEKRGKTFWLMDIAMRAVRQGKKVAFFQAGDMTEDQQIIRIAIYLARKSNKEKYTGTIYKPVRDCILNQFDECDKSIRECNFGIFDESAKKDFHPSVRDTISRDVLIEHFENNPEYRPCHNCLEFRQKPWATVFLKKVKTGAPLEVHEAERIYQQYFIDKNKQFRLSSHVMNTLDNQIINSTLNTWERRDKFIPDLVVIDYADLLVPTVKEFRHGVDAVWKGLRGLSQQRDCLVVTATQADAASYEQNWLKLKNFSEDKRKYSHVTAMYGLNQDPKGREAELGIMRINELMIREGEKSIRGVYVLSSLKTGQPYLHSFW